MRIAEAGTVRAARGPTGRWLAVAAACALITLPALAAESGTQPDTDAPDMAALAAELERLKQRLAELEPLRDRVEHLERELAAARAEQSEHRSTPAEDQRDITALREDGGGDSSTQAETAAADDIAFGGAMRFNLFWNDDDSAVESKRGDSGLDLFRIEADGSIGDVLLSAEYRFYPFMNVLHHGWLGYRFDDDRQLQVGITRVPFGILPYAAHNFWFGTPYYVGLADDYDLGVKYIHTDGPWEWQLAAFKNGELSSSTNLDRYSYDVVALGETANEETNQLNLRGAYTFGAGSACSHEVGLSAQAGQLYNADTDDLGSHWAAAAHLDSRCGRWNLQLQAARYRYRPENPPGISTDTIRLGGFGTSYDIAADASMLVANLAYNLPVPWQAVDQITCYNDFSVVLPEQDRFDDSKLNTTGCLVGMGPLYVYLDLIQAQNMIFFGNGSLAGAEDSDWYSRFNINVGYYW